MTLHLLQKPVPVRVDLRGLNFYAEPDCINDSYRPVKKRQFNALATAVYDYHGRWFIGLKTGGIRLVCNLSDLDGPSQKNIKEARKTQLVSASEVKRDYDLKAFCEEVMLLHNSFDVTIHEVFFDEKKPSCVTCMCDFKWQLHGHVKPVRQYRQLIIFNENGEITTL